MLGVRAVSSMQANVGRRIKSTKKKFSWLLEVDGQEKVVDLFISRMTGKVRLHINGDSKLTATRRPGVTLNYPFKIGRYTFVVVEISGTYTLLLEGRSFDALQRDGQVFHPRSSIPEVPQLDDEAERSHAAFQDLRFTS